MDLMLLRVFQRQVELQCKSLLSANARLEAALARVDMEEIWFAVENLLNASANISKALWGEPKDSAAREPLRASLGMTYASPLKGRGMRNNFEHYDARLDKWWRKSKNHNIADMNVMPSGAIVGVDKIDMFRQLDPTTMNVIF